MEVWAQVVALGVPDELYWRSTPHEMQQLVRAMVARQREEHKAATLRAGLIASAIYNVNRRKGARPVRPQDFVKEGPTQMSANEMAAIFKSWAKSHNRRTGHEQERTR